MRIVFHISLVLILIGQGIEAQAQKNNQNGVADPYNLLRNQYAGMMQSRGVNTDYISEMERLLNYNQIDSDQRFALFLRNFKVPDGKVGFILFLHSGDSLRRVFFEPGKIIEQKTFAITAAELAALQESIVGALGVSKAAKDRSPVLRGAKQISGEPLPTLELAPLLTQATSLLLPEQFNEEYAHLVIIPALTISSFPFQLLQPYSDDSYLIDKCSISIAPGMVDFVSLWCRRGILQGSTSYGEEVVFTFENPLFVSNPAYPTQAKYYFPDLPGAQKEIANTLPYAQSYTLLEGREATKAAILANLPGSDLAYFATHGIASEDWPMDSSYLVVSGEHDPFLTARDIQNFSTSAASPFPEMVILSACQTGLGKAMGAGTTGLARAFLIAGSNHIIMSLWSVDDEATAYLMNRFTYYLQKPNRFMPSEPLRQAMIDTKQKFPNPIYWAGFSAFGITY